MGKIQFTFTVLPEVYLISPAYGYNLVRRDLDLILKQVLIVITPNNNVIIIISETEKQARTDLNTVVTHVTNRG